MQNIFLHFHPTHVLTAVCLSSQLTVEKLCKLKPLHSGLSPEVLADLHWSGISEDALCQCWRTLLTDLKPGHRSWLYDAMQEVTPPPSVIYFSFFSLLSYHPHFITIGLLFVLQSYNFDDSKCKNSLREFTRSSDVSDLPDVSVVRQQVLRRNLQNLTMEVNCLLPFVPLKKLTELLDGETILRNIRLFRNILWSPQQVCVLYSNLYLHAI